MAVSLNVREARQQAAACACRAQLGQGNGPACLITQQPEAAPVAQRGVTHRLSSGGTRPSRYSAIRTACRSEISAAGGGRDQKRERSSTIGRRSCDRLDRVHLTNDDSIWPGTSSVRASFYSSVTPEAHSQSRRPLATYICRPRGRIEEVGDVFECVRHGCCVKKDRAGDSEGWRKEGGRRRMERRRRGEE